jgi:sigma-E factor negative regulatory protein RseC
MRRDKGGFKMAEQIGIVTGIEPGGWAKVLTDRKGACGGCHSIGGGCHGCLAGSKFESRVINAVGAQPGDLVKVSLSSKNFFKGAAMLYLFPIMALLAGAIAGTWAAGRIGWTETTGGVLGAIIGIGIAVVLLIRLDRSQLTRRYLTPTVVEVLSTDKLSPQTPAAKHACCH